ncbi:MAG TPA: hypothetical protein VIK29_11990 [Paludibacter sp.]
MGKGKGILLDDNFELVISPVRDLNDMITSGLVVGNVTQQNQRTILLAEKGEIKESPTLGVGISSFIDDDNPSDLLREIRANLREDGQMVKSCGFNTNGKLVIEGGYES